MWVQPLESSQPRRHEKFLDGILEHNLERESQETIICASLKIYKNIRKYNHVPANQDIRGAGSEVLALYSH